jgi:hypothetical protein
MKTIDMNVFGLLPRMQKADITETFGSFLMRIKSDSNLFTLYALSDFQVEVVYRRRDMKLISVRSVVFPEQVDKYLEKIDISAVYSPGIEHPSQH